MPIHDWTRVDSGLFHAFHQSWICGVCDRLNGGVLPTDYYAVPQRHSQGSIPDVPTVVFSSRVNEDDETELYAHLADHVAVRHRHGEVVAIVEILSPGNKASQRELKAFVDKACELLRQNIHLLIVDLLPPRARDSQGIHKAIWDEIEDNDFVLPSDKQLTLASYDAGSPLTAYVEPVAVGDVLPDMPLFLKPEIYVPAPLESSYQAAWAVFPKPLKHLLEAPPVGQSVNGEAR